MNSVKLIIIVVLTGLLAASLSCGDGTGGDDEPVQNILYNQKIIDNDDFFTGSHWNDPHVFYRDGQFIMYASSDLSWDGVVKIYRLVSADGKDWIITNSGNPVLEPSAGEWDSHCTETPAVVYFSGQYHMFYTGYDVAYDYSNNGADTDPGTVDDDSASKHFKIGHATSPDGITWTKDADPVVSPADPYTDPDPNYDFNQYVVGEPAPVVFNNKIYLYFTTMGVSLEVGATWQTIGLVTSSDGVAWDAPRRVLTPDIAQYPRTTGNEYIGFSTPNAVVIDGKVHLYCDVVLNSPWTQDKIHHASSSDGEAGWTHDPEPLLERSSYSWTESEIRSPSVLEYNNNLYMYFAGHYFEGINPVLCIGLIVYDEY